MKFITADAARSITDTHKPIYEYSNLFRIALEDTAREMDGAINSGKYLIRIVWPNVCENKLADELRKYGYRVSLGSIYATIRWDLTLWQKFKRLISNLYCRW